MSSIYENGEYFAHNPTWDVEDSPWKAQQILQILRVHRVEPKTIAEVGCGAGEILAQLHAALPDNVAFRGYEVSSYAYEMALRRVRPRLEFRRGAIEEDAGRFDLLLVMDVLEHVDDYLGFLRGLAKHGGFAIFHIPLDLSAQTVLRRNALMAARNQVGHLHYFTEETALATLRDAGFDVIDYFFTAKGVELGGGGLARHIARFPRKWLAKVSPSLASRLLGGFSLLVLAKPRDMAG